jgi:hypothetical protein
MRDPKSYIAKRIGHFLGIIWSEVKNWVGGDLY